MAKSKREGVKAGRKGRPIWSGHVSFGLVNIPVSLKPAGIAKETIEFGLIDKRDHAHVGYQRINKDTGEPIEAEDVVKGYEYAKGKYVTFTDEELGQLKARGNQNLEITDFVDAAAIEWIYFSKAYFISPDEGGEKTYALLREALKRTQKVGVTSIVIHNRQHLATIAARGPALVVELLHYYHEVREAKGLNLPSENLKTAGITEKEVKMAEELVKEMSAPWEPQKYRDSYRDDVMRYVERKARKGKDAVADMLEKTPPAEGSPNIVDLMPLLKRSLAAKGPAKKAGAHARKPHLRVVPKGVSHGT